jgi:hypothetical protein
MTARTKQLIIRALEARIDHLIELEGEYRLDGDYKLAGVMKQERLDCIAAIEEVKGE